MREVSVPGKDISLRVDVCFGCQLVWFDALEFETAPSAAPEPEMPIDRALSKAMEPSRAMREAVALAKVESQAERARGADPDSDWKTALAFFGFPVETNTASLSLKPWATWCLSALIAAVSLLAMLDYRAVINAWGLVPAEALRGGGVTLLTSFFLHGGPLHLVGDLYFLFVFGDDVEDFLGRKRFLLLLLAATILGDVAHILGEPHSNVPCIGASGGISGVLAFYALRFPEARLSFLFSGGMFRWGFQWLEIPAMFVFLLWAALQSFGVFMQLSGASNISALAHLGGATAGFLSWLAWRRKS